jgi:acetate kinase
MMARIILSINAGSSSVKISVYGVEEDRSTKELAEMEIDGLTSTLRQWTYVRGLETIAKKEEVDQNISTREDAFKFLLGQLIDDKQLKQICTEGDINYACHRIAHGGDYQESKIIDANTYHHIEALTDLAPLHNGSALEIVKYCVKELPRTKNIAYFDTQFHLSLPEHVRMYAIDPEIARRKKLRKYGFHGISFAFITRSIAEFLNQKESETSIIALHIGSGASACAIKNGTSIDTSMGLTPVDGLPGATRSGSIDPR